MVNFMLKYLGTYQFQTDAFGLLGPASTDSPQAVSTPTGPTQ
jgi:hypothetical protein